MSRTLAMPQAKESRPPKKVDFLQQAPSGTSDEESEAEQESDVEINVDGEPEKDETEQELERLVFGDSAGFRDGLRESSDVEVEDSEQEEEGATGLEGLDDAQVGQIALICTTVSCF